MFTGKCRSVAQGRRTLPLRRGNVRSRACPFKSILQSNSLDEMPFKFFHDKPYKLVLGLRQPDGDWLDIIDNDAVFIDELRQRRKHIQERRSAVLQLVDLVSRALCVGGPIGGKTLDSFWSDQVVPSSPRNPRVLPSPLLLSAQSPALRAPEPCADGPRLALLFALGGQRG